MYGWWHCRGPLKFPWYKILMKAISALKWWIMNKQMSTSLSFPPSFYKLIMMFLRTSGCGLRLLLICPHESCRSYTYVVKYLRFRNRSFLGYYHRETGIYTHYIRCIWGWLLRVPSQGYHHFPSGIRIRLHMLYEIHIDSWVHRPSFSSLSLKIYNNPGGDWHPGGVSPMDI